MVQQLFRTAHSLVPNAFEVIRPGLLTMKSLSENAEGAFFVRYQGYARLYLAAVFAFGAIIILGLKPVLWLWDVQTSVGLYAITLALALELLFGSATHI